MIGAGDGWRTVKLKPSSQVHLFGRYAVLCTARMVATIAAMRGASAGSLARLWCSFGSCAVGYHITAAHMTAYRQALQRQAGRALIQSTRVGDERIHTSRSSNRQVPLPQSWMHDPGEVTGPFGWSKQLVSVVRLG
jgi:hypothetical protein|eukprot:COSAG01_NODE_3457_length_6072_cov_14.110330_4_plen_136_part_00